MVAAIPSPSTQRLPCRPAGRARLRRSLRPRRVAAVAITRRRWAAPRRSPQLVYDVALWGSPPGRRRAALLPRHELEQVRRTGGGRSPSGRAGSASGAGSRSARSSASGGAAGRRRRRRVPGRRRPGAARRPGDRARRQLLQPGAVRRPDELPWALEIDPAHRPAGYARTRRSTRRSSTSCSGTSRSPPCSSGSGASAASGRRAVRALRRRLLGLPHLRGAAARRPRAPHPRAAAELLRGGVLCLAGLAWFAAIQSGRRLRWRPSRRDAGLLRRRCGPVCLRVWPFGATGDAHDGSGAVLDCDANAYSGVTFVPCRRMHVTPVSRPWPAVRSMPSGLRARPPRTCRPAPSRCRGTARAGPTCICRPSPGEMPMYSGGLAGPYGPSVRVVYAFGTLQVGKL